MADRLRVGMYQFCPRLGDREGNLAAIEAGLAGVEADLVVLPELATSGYALPSREAAAAVAESPGSAGLTRLQALAESLGAALLLGLPLAENGKLFNAAALLRPAAPPVFYRKLHLFYREGEVFDPGDRPAPVEDVAGARVGVMICFDWVFPELARSLALAGAELLAHPSNLVLPGFAQAAMVTRAVENRVFAITCNRVGEERYPDEERSLRFTGLSQALDPRGRPLLQFGETDTRRGVVTLDLAEARDKRITPRNHLFADRRPEHYGPLTAPLSDGRES